MLNSKPTEQPQPNQPFYPVSALDLFWPGSPTSPVYPNDATGRAQAFADGLQQTDYDPSQPSKTWADLSVSADDPEPIEYWDYDGAGNKQFLSMSAATARRLNIWGPTGPEVFPAYVPQPTGAMRSGKPMDVTILSNMVQAQWLATAWHIAFSKITTVDFDNDTYPATETRRPYALYVGGAPFYVGQKIAEAKAAGVGAPGHFDGTGWISDVKQPPVNANALTRIPKRLLKNNEQLRAPQVGEALAVFRTDLVGTVGGTPAQTGGFTDDDRAREVRIEEDLEEIKKASGVSNIAP